MRVVSSIDASGLFVADVLVEDAAPVPAGCVGARPPNGLHSPKWTGSGWAEGAAPADVLAVAKEAKRSELKRAFREQYEPTFEAGFLEADYLIRRLSLNLPVPQAERDGLQAVGTGIDRLRGLLGRVAVATTTAEVEGISWTSLFNVRRGWLDKRVPGLEEG